MYVVQDIRTIFALLARSIPISLVDLVEYLATNPKGKALITRLPLRCSEKEPADRTIEKAGGNRAYESPGMELVPADYFGPSSEES